MIAAHRHRKIYYIRVDHPRSNMLDKGSEFTQYDWERAFPNFGRYNTGFAPYRNFRLLIYVKGLLSKANELITDSPTYLETDRQIIPMLDRID